MLVPKRKRYYDSCQLDAQPKNYKSKYSNPNSTDISISTQHIDRKGFSCTTSQENIPINKYSNILERTMLVFVLVAFCLTKSLLCNVVVFTEMPYISESSQVVRVYVSNTKRVSL
jgi:hypothetical protein